MSISSIISISISTASASASASSASTLPFHLILRVMISKQKVSVQKMACAESVGERRSRVRVMISKLNRTNKIKHKSHLGL